MRLTKRLLKAIIEEEASKLESEAKADEVEADEYASALEKKIDYIKALKIEENRLRARLRRITETKRKMQHRTRRPLLEEFEHARTR